MQRNSKKIYPRNVYQFRESPFDKLDSFGIKYTSQQKLFQNLAIFDSDTTSAHDEKFKDTKTITWIGKHVPISVFIVSKPVDEPIFLCISYLDLIVASFIGALENLASQRKAKK